MKSEVVIAVITLIGTLTTAWLQFISKTKIEQYHKTVNGKMEQLIQAEKKASKAEGKEEQRNEVA